MSWPLPEDLSEVELISQLMIDSEPLAASPPPKPLPDWPAIHHELRRKHATFHLLWQEYRQTPPEGYRYSRFCQLYHQWAGALGPVLRQVHEPGQNCSWIGPAKRCPFATLTTP